MILHASLIDVACDIVLGRETSFVDQACSNDGVMSWELDQTLADVRSAAASFLIKAFEHAAADGE